MKFPREVWPSANKQTNTFASKRKLVHSQNEFNSWVKIYNGKMNCFTSVYDYEEYTVKQAVTSTVILDRIFLDFDAHHGEIDKRTGAQSISAEQIQLCYEDLMDVLTLLHKQDYKYNMSFSGRGFHVYVYGEPTTDIRRLTAFFNEMKSITSNGTLDSSAISSRRLRRISNTMNMKASYGDGCYYCIPLSEMDIFNVEQIMELAKKPNTKSFNSKGNTLVKWPEVPPIEESEIEAKVIDVGNLPIPPCMHSAIMVENPTDEARAYLVSWYKDLLLWADFNVGFTDVKVVPNLETRNKMINQITAEIKLLHETHNVWLDFDEGVTKYRVGFIVNGNYNFPNCDKLIANAYCVGKCWRLD
tara:strand:+ start:6005 stop:7078 length:1074 start_codon:yes stop_codon:yes gene_type:complete